MVTNPRPRIALAKAMIRLGALTESLALTVMRPRDLVEFGRLTYGREVDGWSRPELLDEGLYPQEQTLLKHCPKKEGRLLLLGVGGGREAVALAQAGFSVVGLDFVAGMVERARALGAERGLPIEGIVQEISQLDVPPDSFDVVWLSARMYSCVPTRTRRTAMLQTIARALQPGGVFICQFWWNAHSRRSQRNWRLHQAVAWLTRGHSDIEPGDMLWARREFIHEFSDEAALRKEFRDGGFEVVHLDLDDRRLEGGAILRRGDG